VVDREKEKWMGKYLPLAEAQLSKFLKSDK
jgi:hypothetical protein